MQAAFCSLGEEASFELATIFQEILSTTPDPRSALRNIIRKVQSCFFLIFQT